MSHQPAQTTASFLTVRSELRYEILNHAKSDALNEEFKKSHRTNSRDSSHILEECHCPACISDYRRWMAEFGAKFREVDERIINDIVYLERKWREFLARLARAW